MVSSLGFLHPCYVGITAGKTSDVELVTFNLIICHTYCARHPSSIPPSPASHLCYPKPSLCNPIASRYDVSFAQTLNPKPFVSGQGPCAEPALTAREQGFKELGTKRHGQ